MGEVHVETGMASGGYSILPQAQSFVQHSFQHQHRHPQQAEEEQAYTPLTPSHHPQETGEQPQAQNEQHDGV